MARESFYNLFLIFAHPEKDFTTEGKSQRLTQMGTKELLLHQLISLNTNIGFSLLRVSGWKYPMRIYGNLRELNLRAG